MGEIIIYRGVEEINLFNLIPFCTVTSAQHSQELLSVDKIEITIETVQPMVFFLGDYIIHEGRKFTLNMNPKFQKENDRHYIYNLSFEGVQYDLLRKKYFNYDSLGFYTTGDFPLTGEINVFLVALLNNAERDEDEYDWILGTYPTDTETKTITFDNVNCLAALQSVCQEFEQEFEIVQDIVKKTNTLNIKKIGATLPYSFEYGYRNGLYGLSRDNVSEGQVITRLYPYGSTENIPTSYRNFSPRLKLPERFANYIQDDAKVALYGLVEEIKNYDDIKPTFKGIITTVGSIDNTKATITFTCSNMDFDLNEKAADNISTKYLIAGTPAKIHVNKGNLAGYEFELHKYTHATKTFEIKQFINDRDQKFPDPSTIFMFAPGDEFTFIDIIMPDIYISNAEDKLKEKAIEDYDKLSQNNVKYSLDIDPLFFAAIGGGVNVKYLGIGDFVNIKDTPLAINKTSRIISLNRDLLNFNGYKYNAEISDTFEIALVTQILQDIEVVTSQVETIIIRNKEAMLSGYRRMRELQGLVFDTDGYFDPVNIKPNSIETNMLTVGAKSQQLTLESVVFTANKNSNPNLINISNGKLVHFSIDETGIREWSLLGIEQTLSSNAAHYVYARVPRGNNTGTFLITTEQKKFDSEDNFYNFLVAVLFSPQNGIRLTELMYGSTFIHGRTITTGRIQSVDGLTWFDLDTGQIKGKIEFLPDSPAFDQINNSLVIGSRNLILDSKIEQLSNLFGFGMRQSSMALISGQKYTFSVHGFCKQVSPGKFLRASVFNGNKSFIQNIDITETTDVTKKITFTSPIDDIVFVEFYYFDSTNPRNGNVSVTWCKLEKGNVATDWTPAPEDIENAIENAENQADIANAILADISNDNKLTAQEKQALKKEFDVIVAEKPQLQAQATTYGVNVTNYVNAYNNLVVYTNPLLVNINVTSDIVGSVLRSTYSTYYTAKVNLLKGITDMVNDDLSEITDMVNEAQQTADAAWNQLSDLASDNKLTASEKQITLNEWNRIKSEYLQNNTVAGGLSISVTNYQSAYNALNLYITPLLVDLTSTTTIDGTTFRNTFKNYYDQNIAIVTAIANKQIENIQIGGRNLLLKTGIDYLSNLTIYGQTFPTNYDTITKIKWFDVLGSNINGTEIVHDKFYTPNETGLYTFSIIVYCDKVINSVLVSFYTASGGHNYVPAHIKSLSNNKFVISATVNISNLNPIRIVDLNNIQLSSNPQYIGFQYPKLEKGNKATDWIPAPEDIDSAIATSNSNSSNALAQALNALNTANAAAAVTSFLQTTIDGNVVSTGTLQVGDVNGANAMITGVTDQPNGDSIRFAAGKAYAQKYLSPFQVLANGMVRFVNPTTGRKVFELGYNANIGKVVFDIYNESTGVKAVSIGPEGIMFTGYVPESYTTKKFRKLTTSTFTESAIKAEMTASVYQRFQTGRQSTPAQPGDWISYDVGLNVNTTAYEYYEGRNFESAGNAQYAGFYTTANKFGNHIDDGIYARQFVIGALYDPTNNIYTIYHNTDVYSIANGRIIAAIPVSILLTIANIPTRSTIFPPEDYNQ